MNTTQPPITVNQPIQQSQSFNQPIPPSFNQPIPPSFNQPSGQQSNGHPINPPLNQAQSQSSNQSVQEHATSVELLLAIEFIIQSIQHANSQPIIQPISQSIDPHVIVQLISQKTGKHRSHQSIEHSINSLFMAHSLPPLQAINQTNNQAIIQLLHSLTTKLRAARIQELKNDVSMAITQSVNLESMLFQKSESALNHSFSQTINPSNVALFSSPLQRSARAASTPSFNQAGTAPTTPAVDHPMTPVKTESYQYPTGTHLTNMQTTKPPPAHQPTNHSIMTPPPPLMCTITDVVAHEQMSEHSHVDQPVSHASPLKMHQQQSSPIKQSYNQSNSQANNESSFSSMSINQSPVRPAHSSTQSANHSTNQSPTDSAMSSPSPSPHSASSPSASQAISLALTPTSPALLLELLSILHSHPDSEPFLYPVSAADAPGYYDTIKTPMDFDTIKKKITAQTINQPYQLHQLLLQVYRNAYSYNDRKTTFYKMARNLDSFSGELFKRYFPGEEKYFKINGEAKKAGGRPPKNGTTVVEIVVETPKGDIGSYSVNADVANTRIRQKKLPGSDADMGRKRSSDGQSATNRGQFRRKDDAEEDTSYNPKDSKERRKAKKAKRND